MRIEHYTRYLSEDYRLEIDAADGGGSSKTEVRSGRLIHAATGHVTPIVDAIPRFVDGSNYADSFGYQWNRFRATQLDSRTGRPLSAQRFWSSSKWTPQELAGKTVLEAGSGAGRFTEILCGVKDLDLVSFDYSTAVDANHENNAHPNVFLFQGDIYDLPLKEESFDFLVCYGVLQHTPDPEKAFRTLLRYLKPGGKFSVDVYVKMRTPAPWYFPKYFWRPLTTRMDKERLLRIIKLYVPLWFPVDTLIKHLPIVGHTLSGCIPIPCWNYCGRGLSYRQKLEWAVMDTFDALSPAYDFPKSPEEVRQWCDPAALRDVEVFLGGNGVVANGTKI